MLNLQQVGTSDASASQLMADLGIGSREAAGKLVELFYPELRRVARTCMAGERVNHTWQPTTLVNELYLELTRIKTLGTGDQTQKDAFLALSAFLMKRLLIHHARPLSKRIVKADLDQVFNTPSAHTQDLSEIEDLLTKLSAIDPILRTVVEMKIFEGLERDEIAVRLGCSVRTVARHWAFAQQWLQVALSAP
ncbi:MAG: sigma-70 family RNA polymerase sigma factor [Bryobacteraceae bacterium]